MSVTHKALYAKKIDAKVIDKIDVIAKNLQVSKWLVVEKLLSQALGVKNKNPLDLAKWLKLK